MFKKFLDFLNETSNRIKTSNLSEKIPDPTIEKSKKVDDGLCPKCGSDKIPCNCSVDDYYDSKLPQQTPKPNKSKTKIKGDEL